MPALTGHFRDYPPVQRTPFAMSVQTLVLLTALAVGLASAAPPPPPGPKPVVPPLSPPACPSGEKPLQVFVMMGQSNMLGEGAKLVCRTRLLPARNARRRCHVVPVPMLCRASDPSRRTPVPVRP